jgi:hypothetical protein
MQNMGLLAEPVVHNECAADVCSVERRDSASQPMSNVLSEPLCTDMHVDTRSQQEQKYVDIHVALSSKVLYYNVL